MPPQQGGEVLQVVANLLDGCALEERAEFFEHAEGFVWVVRAFDVMCRVSCERKGNSEWHGFARTSAGRDDPDTDGRLAKQRRKKLRAFGRSSDDLVIMRDFANCPLRNRFVGDSGLKLGMAPLLGCRGTRGTGRK